MTADEPSCWRPLFVRWASAQLAQQPSMPYVRWAELEVSPADVRRAPGSRPGEHRGHHGTGTRCSRLPFRSRKGEPSPHARARDLHRRRRLPLASAVAAFPEVRARRAADSAQPLPCSRRCRSCWAPSRRCRPHRAATHVRVAELEIDPAQLDAYKAAVTEEIEDSIRLEPGVLAIYCVALKDSPRTCGSSRCMRTRTPTASTSSHRISRSTWRPPNP